MDDSSSRDAQSTSRHSAPCRHISTSTEPESLSLNDHANKRNSIAVDTVLQRVFFRSKYSLRFQVFISFGIVSILSILFVMTAATLTAAESGRSVKSVARSNLENWAKTTTAHAARYVADAVTEKLNNFDAASRIMRIITQERFVGYPDHPGYEEDLLVPFFDMDTNRTKYPLNETELIPLDWDWEPNLNGENMFDHLQHRTSWYDLRYISTAVPCIRMPGACDPNVTDPESRTYYPNCTDENNDVSTGGKISPTTTFASIHKKSSDFAMAVLRPLYEYHADVKNIGLYFANDGAGAVVRYPASQANSKSTYTSIGCDWMNSTHPLDASRTLGTVDQIAHCHEDGEGVNAREYNPLERGWCKQQALNPHSPQSIGPYLDAFQTDLWLMTFGQAVYDSVTKEFIACTLADVSIDRFNELISNHHVTTSSRTSFVRWDDEGTVVASDLWDPGASKSTVSVTEVHDDVTPELFHQMKQHFLGNWGPGTKPEDYSNVYFIGNSVISSHPVPIPPKEYTDEYEPEFMIISSFSQEEVLRDVLVLEDRVDSEVNELVLWTLVSGLVGIACVLCVIFLVSIWLSKPMSWMDTVASQIISSFGSVQKEINYEESSWLKLSPQTEITLLVEAFQKMVKKFSGGGTAKLVKYREVEVQNRFDLKAFFHRLYIRRKSPGFKHLYVEFPEMSEQHQVRMGGLMPSRRHWGPSFRGTEDFSSASSLQISIDAAKEEKKMHQSPLFWWIFGSIIIPLLITMLTIAFYATYNISDTLPALVGAVEDTYVRLERGSLPLVARIRADFATEILFGFLRDLHLYQRVVGWLLFGAIRRSDSYSTTVSLSEHCKDQPSGSCSYDPKLHVCDCKSNDKFKDRCQYYDEDTRKYQHIWFEGPAEDAWPNGDRNFTSFPEVASTPNTTLWWEPDNLPGKVQGSPAAGYKTTYDRVRVTSAASMVMIPLLNYDDDSQLEASTGVYHAFDQDGMIVGYAGCTSYDLNAAYFQSTNFTTANPDLCPDGKYGFDARCRAWYVHTKETALDALPDRDFLHVTPPYNFTATMVAATAATSWIDPLDGTYVGQALIDVDTTRILERLTPEQTPLLSSGFHTLITTKRDQFGFDTVVGPGLTFGTDYGAIEDILLANDDCVDEGSVSCNNRRHFENQVLEKKRLGMNGTVSFNRTGDDGEQELVYYAFAPVEVASFREINISDISQGVMSFASFPYSLGIGVTRSGLYQSFDSVEGPLNKTVSISIAILTISIVAALVFVSFISSRVTVSIIIPVAQLLSLIQSIARSEFSDELPEIIGGSREVSSVRDTFENLHNVVRMANSAYLAGDLETAHSTLSNALELFAKLGNEKAMGVANNNLGNTMLTMYRLLEKTGAPTFDRMTKSEVVSRGVKYFNKAIDLGEVAIERINQQEGWSTNYLIFMQQLSNRYFNRALFLLTVSDNHHDPQEAVRQGLMDLSTARDMDREVVDNGDQQGFKGDRDVYFDLLLSRIKGILCLVQLGYEDEWGLEEILDDAQRVLVEALKNPYDVLFSSMEPAGQMQRLDGVLMSYYRVSEGKDQRKAAEVAIRMLVEDDYVMRETASLALNTLIEYVDLVDTDELGGEDPSNLKAALYRLRRHTRESMSLIAQGSNLFSKEMYRQSNLGDLCMEVF